MLSVARLTPATAEQQMQRGRPCSPCRRAATASEPTSTARSSGAARRMTAVCPAVHSNTQYINLFLSCGLMPRIHYRLHKIVKVIPIVIGEVYISSPIQTLILHKPLRNCIQLTRTTTIETSSAQKLTNNKDELLSLRAFLVQIVLLMILTGCEKSTHAVIQAAQTEPIANAVVSTNAPALTTRCKGLIHQVGLPGASSLIKSHILYLAQELFVKSGGDEIWAISIEDGSEKLLLHDVPSPFLGLAFLPDGNHFVGYGQTLLESDLSGTPLRTVNQLDYAKYFPQYSPMWNLIGNNPKAGENQYDGGGNGFLLQSPDGKHIAVWGSFFESSSADNSYPLMLKDKESQQEIEVFYSEPGETIQGNWSPDGQHFVFTWYKNTTDYYSVVYSVNANGSGLIALTEHLNQETLERPRWSPDGNKIAIPIWSRDGGHDMLVIDYQTHKTVRFKISPIIKLASVMDQGEMVWSPDSQWFAYISQSPDHDGIEVLNVETGEIYCGIDNKEIGIEMMDWR